MKELVVKVSREWEDLLSTSTDMSILLFRAVLPHLKEALKVADDRTLSFRRVRTGQFVIEDSYILYNNIWWYLQEGLEHFYAAQHYFDSFISKDPERNEDTHVFTRDALSPTAAKYRFFENGLFKHVEDLRKNAIANPQTRRYYVGDIAKEVDAFLKDKDEILRSIPTHAETHMAFRHGNLSLVSPRDQKVLFTKARLKFFPGAVEKHLSNNKKK